MEHPTKFWSAKVVLAVVVLGGMAAGTVAYVQRPKNLAPNFKTSPVTRGEIIQTVTANGSLMPVRNVEVGSQISGTLLEVKVDFNAKVTTGQVLAQIDPATYERALLQAEAELANANASLKLGQLNFNRARELFDARLISKSEFEQTEANLSQAEATVKMRQANVERAKVDLSRTTIYAPIEGMVISRKVEVGQTVAASLNAPTLFVIANDLAKMQIEAAVSEADVGGVAEGQAVDFSVDAFPRRPFKGTVQQVRFAPTTNQNVVTYTTIVGVENPELKLRPGMTANASIIIAERNDVLRIPNAALRFRPPEDTVSPADTNAPGPLKSGVPRGENRRDRPRRKEAEGPRRQTVYLVAKEPASALSSSPRLRPVTVTLGISDGGYTEVLDGLTEVDVVATGTVNPVVAAAPTASPFGGGPFGGAPRPR